MAKVKTISGGKIVESRPKKSRQGNGKHTKHTATSRNGRTKATRGQGR